MTDHTRTLITSEPTVYGLHSPHSWVRDMVLDKFRSDKDSRDRIARHLAEMAADAEERDRASWAAVRGFETRVEPSSKTSHFPVPFWSNEFFGTALRPEASLSALMKNYPLPDGVSSINTAILSSGTTADAAVDNAATPGSDITDTLGTASVVTLVANVDVSLQALEQSPAPGLDDTLGTDVGEALVAQLETGLRYGLGAAFDEIQGITTLSGITAVTYASDTPSGGAMWPFLGMAAAQLADARKRPPECWLMRTARYQWISSAEDAQGRPFSLPQYHFGSGVAFPDAIGAINGVPCYADENISPVLGSTANQDQAICLRPSDLLLFTAPTVTVVLKEVLSGSLTARIQVRKRVCALVDRYVSGVATVGGSGFAVQSGW